MEAWSFGIGGDVSSSSQTSLGCSVARLQEAWVNNAPWCCVRTAAHIDSRVNTLGLWLLEVRSAVQGT